MSFPRFVGIITKLGCGAEIEIVTETVTDTDRGCDRNWWGCDRDYGRDCVRGCDRAVTGAVMGTVTKIMIETVTDTVTKTVTGAEMEIARRSVTGAVRGSGGGVKETEGGSV